LQSEKANLLENDKRMLIDREKHLKEAIDRMQHDIELWQRKYKELQREVERPAGIDKVSASPMALGQTAKSSRVLQPQSKSSASEE